MTDEVNLEHAQLFADSSRGRFIPQYFAQTVNREYVTGVGEDDYKVLEAGPDHEHYDDAWAGVLDNAEITDPKTGVKHYLHQDEDLWIVPVEKEEATTITVLGIKFRKMERDDYDGFAGADEGSYIAESDTATLIYSPTAQSISEVGYDEVKKDSWQRDWNMTVIL